MMTKNTRDGVDVTYYLLGCGHTAEVYGPQGATTGSAWCGECEMAETVRGLAQMCEDCGTGPFFHVAGRDYPELCQDCVRPRKRDEGWMRDNLHAVWVDHEDRQRDVMVAILHIYAEVDGVLGEVGNYPLDRLYGADEAVAGWARLNRFEGVERVTKVVQAFGKDGREHYGVKVTSSDDLGPILS